MMLFLMSLLMCISWFFVSENFSLYYVKAVIQIPHIDKAYIVKHITRASNSGSYVAFLGGVM